MGRAFFFAGEGEMQKIWEFGARKESPCGMHGGEPKTKKQTGAARRKLNIPNSKEIWFPDAKKPGGNRVWGQSPGEGPSNINEAASECTRQTVGSSVGDAAVVGSWGPGTPKKIILWGGYFFFYQAHKS